MADKINKSAKLDKSKALTFDEALNFLKEERGLNIDNFLEYQSKVRKAESNGDYTAIQVPRKGYTSAPGRGAYQYEMDTDGGSGSAITALNRAKTYAKRNGLTLPDDIINSDGDFSKMSPGSQDMVDLFNLREAPSGDINAINKGDYGNVYVNHHYAGPKDERPKKLEYFNSVTANMKKAEASTEASTEGIPLAGVGPIGIVEAQDFRAIATMALGGRPLLKSNQTIEMSKNKKNVLKVAKGNYPELPKYAGGGSPVSSPNPQPYTFNPQSVNPGSVATLQSRAQPIDTSGAIQIMQNSDNLAVKNRELDFQIEQEKARVSKLEGKERDRAESVLMASYSPNIDEMIQNYGLDPKFKRDQELISFLRQEEKNFKDQQYVVVGKNKGNERAVDSGLAQLQLDFMAKINSNEDIRKQREINAQYAAVDERVKKSQKGQFSQARLYTDLYEQVNDYKNGITDEIPEGTFDLNRYSDNSEATEAGLLAATNSYLSNAVSGKAVQKDGYQWWSTYYDDSLLSDELTTAYNTDLVSIITADVDFKRKYNIKDGEEAAFAEKYYQTIRGGEELKFRTNKDKLSKINKDDVDSDGLTAEARIKQKQAEATAAAKKSKVSNFNLGSIKDEDGNATAGLDIRVEEKRENGTLTGLYDVKYGNKGKQLTDAGIRNGKLFLPYDSAESRDFLVSGGFLQKGLTTIFNNDVNELDEGELGKALTKLGGFEFVGDEGILIPLTAIEGGTSSTEDGTEDGTGTTAGTDKSADQKFSDPSYAADGVDYDLISKNEQKPLASGESSDRKKQTGIYSVRVEKSGKASFGAKQMLDTLWGDFAHGLSEEYGLGYDKDKLVGNEGNTENILGFIDDVIGKIGEDEFRKLETEYLYAEKYKPAIDFAKKQFTADTAMTPKVITFIADSANQHGGVNKITKQVAEELKNNPDLDPTKEEDVLLAFRDARLKYIKGLTSGKTEVTEDMKPALYGRVNNTYDELVGRTSTSSAAPSTSSAAPGNSLFL